MNYEAAIEKSLKNLRLRRLCICSEGILEQRIIDTLKNMGIPVDCRLADDEKEYGIRVIHSVEELDGGAEKYFVFVALYTGHKEIVEKLMEAGFRYTLDFIATNIALYVEDLTMVDPLLTYTRREDKIGRAHV